MSTWMRSWVPRGRLQRPAGVAHRRQQVLAGGPGQAERVGDLRDRIARAVEGGDDLLRSQIDGKLGGGHPRLLSDVWVVGPGGVGPGLAHGRSPVGRNVREAGTGFRNRRPAALVRWPLPVSAGLVGLVASAGRAGGVRPAQSRRGTSAGVTRRGRGRVGAAPLLSVSDDARSWSPVHGRRPTGRGCESRCSAVASVRSDRPVGSGRGLVFV